MLNKKFKHLKKKIKINNKFFKNRIISSPISINMASKGYVTKNIINFFSNLAKSGVSMVTIGAAAVSEQGNDTLNGMILGPNKYLNKLKLLSKSIKKFNAYSSIQIYHVGAQGNPIHNKQEIVGPSKYFCKSIGIECKALSLEEIKKIKNDFIQAIIQAENANFDFIEIHLAHGYLLHEFLSKHFNKRTDLYGKSLINRFRIISEILEDVYKKNPKIKGKIGFRLSANDYVKNGLNINELKKIVKLIDKYQPAYFVITAGLYETAKFKYIDMKKGKYWEYAKKIKQITKTAVIAQGGITNIEDGEKLIKKKFCDLFGMAQSLIADPRLIKKTLNKKEKDIIPCIAHLKIGACHRCRYLKQKNLTFSCITPTSWKPNSDVLSKNEIKKDLKIWKKLNNEVYGNKKEI